MRKAIILFNLGGPDKLESVKPFLFNLFYDPAIINLPNILRYPIAKLISKKRESVAKNIDSDTMSKYAEIYEARKGLVVAEILDNSCEGCGAMVPPQSINEALSQNIVFCGNCSRFLFKSEN